MAARRGALRTDPTDLILQVGERTHGGVYFRLEPTYRELCALIDTLSGFDEETAQRREPMGKVAVYEADDVDATTRMGRLVRPGEGVSGTEGATDRVDRILNGPSPSLRQVHWTVRVPEASRFRSISRPGYWASNQRLTSWGIEISLLVRMALIMAPATDVRRHFGAYAELMEGHALDLLLDGVPILKGGQEVPLRNVLPLLERPDVERFLLSEDRHVRQRAVANIPKLAPGWEDRPVGRRPSRRST